jgi:hypothetical protein
MCGTGDRASARLRRGASFDYLVGTGEERWRHGEAEVIE